MSTANLVYFFLGVAWCAFCIIGIVAIYAYIDALRQDAQDYIPAPKKNRLRKPPRVPVWERAHHAYQYWTKGGMSLRESIAAAWRVLG